MPKNAMESLNNKPTIVAAIKRILTTHKKNKA